MSEVYYTQAWKLAQKEARACAARGVSPCLPVMDDFIPEERSVAGTDLGVIEIPTEFIVGTKTRGRVNSFAPNFMPLLDPKSEFADKWMRLCEAHLAEGIREPILAYEFMNRFYVAEGNKRVSVLKFFDAPQITAHVIRVLPERTPDTEGYYAFLDFYRLSRINTVEFSRPGGYAALQRLVGKGPDEVWTEDEQKRFLTVWFYFCQAFDSLGGYKLRVTAGDALLAYLEVYGYPSIRDKSAQEIKTAISSVWEEIVLQEEPEPLDVKLAPTEQKAGVPGVVRKVLSAAELKPRKVAFIHGGTTESSVWTRSHERGRAHVQRVLGDEIQTTAYFDALAGDADALIEQAVADGSTVLFTTSPRLLQASLRAAVAHPEVTIFNCSLNAPHRYIRTYFARMYEVKFIVGAIAGALAGDDPIGYLADEPILGSVAGINAFALGAQMVNPRARVCLEWSADGDGADALRRLTDRGVRLVSSRDLARVGREGFGSLGLMRIGGEQPVNLATPLWQWGSYYEQLLRLNKSHSLQSEYQSSRRALNYYWGISAGVVELQCAETVPPATKKMAAMLQNSIRAGLCDPFSGPLYSKSGLVLEAGKTLTPEQIVRMDWLSETVDGVIPTGGEQPESRG